MLRIWVLILVAFGVQLANANVLGDMQTFAPNSDGLDFITVHTSRPLTKGFFAFGGHLTYARDHLLVYRDLDTQEQYDYHDQLGEFDLTIGYAVTDKVAVFFEAPTLLYHESDSGQDVKAEVSKGVHTYRPGFKWSFWDMAFIGSIDILNVTNSPYTGVDANPIYNLELAKTFRAADQVAYGLNLGYRIRTPTERPSDGYMFPLDDQLTFSAARSAPFIWQKSRWVLEGIFSYPMQKSPYKDAIDASSADILFGLKHRILRNLNLDWGATVEPFVKTLAPRYRVFAGLVYYWNPGWSSNKDRETAPSPVAESSKRYAVEEDRGQDFDPLVVTPEYTEVYEGAVVRMKATGGVGPYSYRIISGDGHLNVAQTYYRAPLKAEKAEVEVRDARDQVVIVHITVKTPPTPNEVIRIKNLNFVFDTANLVPASRKEIDRIIKVFKKKRVSSIIVEGHTDSKGSEEYNLDLSERRADTIAKLLIEGLRLKPEQASAIGFGESRPIATNETEKGRLMNRRVDLKVYYR